MAHADEFVENAEFTINAWRGGDAPASGRFAAKLHAFAKAPPGLRPVQLMLAAPLPVLRRWDGTNGGRWTIVLKHHPEKPDADQATPDDAPPSIQRLWKHRGSPPILRYLPPAAGTSGFLLRYERVGDTVVTAPYSLAQGTTAECLARVPYYLLLVGPPSDLPWSLQYDLNGVRAVGRLDITEEEGLKNYVDRLIDGWDDESATASHTLVWAVNHRSGARDVTQVLHDFVASRFQQHFETDEDVTLHPFLAGSEATGPALCKQLAAVRPGLIVTTSHGAVPGSADRAARRAALGLPVDQGWSVLDADGLLKSWQPDGAVWYCHACCSAGTDDARRFDGLVAPNTEAAEVLRDAGELGETVAPLPRLLLGADRPLRAFVGHVGPTFSWTLREPATRERLTEPILDAFYHHFYQPEVYPVGFALRQVYGPLATLHGEYETARAYHKTHPKLSRTAVVDRKLSAEDVRSVVLLGDPTVLRPPIPSLAAVGVPEQGPHPSGPASSRRDPPRVAGG